MIDRLVTDSKLENEEVRGRLKNIQRKQQELLSEMEGYKVGD